MSEPRVLEDHELEPFRRAYEEWDGRQPMPEDAFAWAVLERTRAEGVRLAEVDGQIVFLGMRLKTEEDE